MKALIRFFAEQRLFANLLAIFVLVIGLLSAFLVKREVFPNISFDIISVSTIIPGASAVDVEKTVTSPLEEELREVDGVKKMFSYSAEGQSRIILQLDANNADALRSERDVDRVINRVVNELPERAERPVVKLLETRQQPIVQISVYSSTLSAFELRERSRQLEKQIERIKGVARVDPVGLRKREVRVQISPQKLARYRLSLSDVVDSLRTHNLSVPGGVLRGREENDFKELIIRTIGDFQELDDIGEVVLRANDFGRAVRIRDVADIELGLEEPVILPRTNGERAVVLTVVKQEAVDAISLVESLKGFLAEQDFKDLELTLLNDSSFFIKNRLEVLGSNLIVGILLVGLILSFLLSLRISIVVSMAIPFSFLGTMIVFYLTNQSLNVVSLVGLIIVVGMLVDNAIVVVDSITESIKEGLSPEEASVEGTYRVWRSIIAASLTTIIAFVPMLFMTGIFGKIVFVIPVGVIVALGFSLLAAFIILPSQISQFVKAEHLKAVDGEKAGFAKRLFLGFSRFWDDKLTPAYLVILRRILKFRYLVLAGLAALFVGSVFFAANVMRIVLFPPDGVEIFFVKSEVPTGTSLERHEEMLKPIEQALKKLSDEELMGFITTVGLQQEEPNDPNQVQGTEYGQIAVYLTPENQRSRNALEMIDEIKAAVSTDGFRKLVFDRVNPGPPVGKPVSLGVRGRAYEDILPAVAFLKEKLSEVNGVRDINDSYLLGKEELQVRVNEVEAAAAGLSVTDIGNAVRAGFEGIVATTMRDLDEETDIRVMYPLKDRQRFENLKDLQVSNRFGNLTGLESVASIERGRNLLAIEHEGGDRQVKVTADIDNDITDSTRVNNLIRSLLPEMTKKFPLVTVAFGGEDEDTKESFVSLGRAFGVAALGILFVMILTFGSLAQPFVVMITIPIGITAALLAFFVHGLPITFMGMLGIIALSGVIVNNAIIFVDFVNQERKQGRDRWKSIEEAARMRIRPIFLTTATTVLGVLPTAYGIGGLDRFVIPIAIAIGWGLVFGSMLTAFFFPAALAVLDDILEKFSRVKNES
jgi:multidrug efflux pump subunit AcrB